MTESTSSPTRILLIDDEAPIRRFLRALLEADGYSIIGAGTAREGILAVAREAPGLVILGLGLPGADGLSVLREVRSWSQVPILVLSVRSDEAGKVAALDSGAQDYVVRPFGMKELLARIRSLLRNRGGAAAPAVVESADLRIDPGNHTVTQAGTALHLTRREFDLLWLLASQAGRLITQNMIVKSLWGPAHVEDSQ